MTTATWKFLAICFTSTPPFSYCWRARAQSTAGRVPAGFFADLCPPPVFGRRDGRGAVAGFQPHEHRDRLVQLAGTAGDQLVLEPQLVEDPVDVHLPRPFRAGTLGASLAATFSCAATYFVAAASTAVSS